ncbi:MAG: hypothetical protein R3D84_04620 [Paracoccaceae bacterium]
MPCRRYQARFRHHAEPPARCAGHGRTRRRLRPSDRRGRGADRSRNGRDSRNPPDPFGRYAVHRSDPSDPRATDGTEIGRDALRARFEAVYFRRFRVELAEIRAAVVNVNTSVIGARAAIDLSTLIAPEDRRATLAEAETVRRPVWFDGWHDTPVYWRDHLPAGFTLTGPAIVEQMDTTVVIGPGEVARGDGEGNILIDVGGAA